MANKNPCERTRFNSGTARKAGIKSGEARKALKSFVELDLEVTTDNERIEMLTALKRAAKHGNIKAFEVYRDTMGMKPEDKVHVSQVDPEAVTAVSSFINGESDD